MGGSELAAWIRRQLVRREWSQADFARRLGVATGQVSEWSTGKRVPSPESCIRIADVFNADPNDVLTLAGHRPPDPAPDDGPRAELVALVRHGATTASSSTTATARPCRVRWRKRASTGTPPRLACPA